MVLTMNNLKLDACLLHGLNYSMGDGIVILNHTLDYIYDNNKMGIDEYYRLLSIINFDKKALLNNGLLEKDIDYYIMGLTIEMLEKFIECKEVKYHINMEVYVVYINDIEFVLLDKNKLIEIFNVIKQMYRISDADIKKDDIVFDNDEVAKKFAEFFEAEKNMDDTGDKVTLSSVIEYVSSKHPSINLLNIWGLTVWQLQRTYIRLSMIDECDRVINGISFGAIDSKKINIEKLRADKVIR